MRVVSQFLMRFWVAALALSILVVVLSIIDALKLARKTWGWWQRNPDTPELLTAVFISTEPRPGSRNERTIQQRQQG